MMYSEQVFAIQSEHLLADFPESARWSGPPRHVQGQVVMSIIETGLLCVRLVPATGLLCGEIESYAFLDQYCGAPVDTRFND